MHNAKNYETFKTVDENCEERTLNGMDKGKLLKLNLGNWLRFFVNRVPSRMVNS